MKVAFMIYGEFMVAIEWCDGWLIAGLCGIKVILLGPQDLSASQFQFCTNHGSHLVHKLHQKQIMYFSQ